MDGGRRAGEGHPVVSVIIPAHNAGGTLADQLDALKAQDAPYLHEVIVVDSLSTDDTSMVAVTAASRWGKVRVVHADRPGANVARNVGVKATSSEAVLMCDADDVVGDGWVEALAEALRGADVVRGRYETALLNDAAKVAARGSLESERIPTQGAVFGGLGGCCGFRRTAWAILGGLREHHYGADDMEFFWRAHASGLRVSYVPEAVVHYRLRSEFAALYRQQKTWASSRALLYKEFGEERMPRRTVVGAIKGWGWALLHARDRRSIDPTIRGRWVRAQANNVGRLKGSLRHRVFYP